MRFRPQFRKLVRAVKNAMDRGQMSKDSSYAILRYALALEIQYQLERMFHGLES